MPKIIFIAFLLLTILPMTVNSQVNKVINMEWVSKSNYDTIVYTGLKQTVIQLCDTEVDSIITTGTLTFSNANIRNIGECVYIYVLKDTIINKVEIRTKGKNGFIALKKYFEKIVNTHYIETNIGSNSISTAICYFYSKPSQIIFFTDKNNKYSTLILELTDIGPN